MMKSSALLVAVGGTCIAVTLDVINPNQEREKRAEMLCVVQTRISYRLQLLKVSP